MGLFYPSCWSGYIAAAITEIYEILSWAIVLVVVVVLFVLMQMIKPYISKKKTEAEALEEIKNYYYERYKKTGKLDKLEPWND